MNAIQRLESAIRDVSTQDYFVALGVTDKMVYALETLRELAKAAAPFSERNSSEQLITVTVKTSDVDRLRALLYRTGDTT